MVVGVAIPGAEQMGCSARHLVDRRRLNPTARVAILDDAPGWHD
jgi:hypothetical protein